MGDAWTVYAVPSEQLDRAYQVARHVVSTSGAVFVVGPALADGCYGEAPNVAVGLMDASGPMDVFPYEEALAAAGISAWSISAGAAAEAVEIAFEGRRVAVVPPDQVEFVTWEILDVLDLERLQWFGGFHLDEPELVGQRCHLKGTVAPIVPAESPLTGRRPLVFGEQRFDHAIESAKLLEQVRRSVRSAVSQRLERPEPVDLGELEILRRCAEIEDAELRQVLEGWADGQLRQPAPEIEHLLHLADALSSPALRERIQAAAAASSPSARLEATVAAGDRAQIVVSLFEGGQAPTTEMYERVIDALGLSGRQIDDAVLTDLDRDPKIGQPILMRLFTIPEPKRQLVLLDQLAEEATPGMALLIEAAAAFAWRRLGEPVPDDLVDRLLLCRHRRTGYWIRQLTRPM